MKLETTRRDILKGSLAFAGLGVIGVPEWAMPILAADESVVQFTDIPENVRWDTPPDRRMLDVRTIDGPFTAVDKFATTQHYGHPDVDTATFKLKFSGMVNSARGLSLDDLKKLGSHELVAGFSAPATGDRCRACPATANGPASRSRPSSRPSA